MTKTTNKHQIEIILSSMQAHPDIACGFYKGNKEELNRFWRNLEEKLNAAGPPRKNVSEWKKVWADQKKYVRHKASQNLKGMKGTGGGPNNERKLTQTEEAIYQLIGMRESVEGVGTTFGLGTSTTMSQTSQNIDVLLDDLSIEGNCDMVSDILRQETAPSQPPRKKRKLEQATDNNSPSDVLVQELYIQKDISEAIQEQQQHTKKIYRSIDRLYDLQKRHFEVIERTKKEEMEELKRHNLVMEKLRLRELEDKAEKNRRLLEIEDLKYKY